MGIGTAARKCSFLTLSLKVILLDVDVVNESRYINNLKITLLFTVTLHIFDCEISKTSAYENYEGQEWEVLTQNCMDLLLKVTNF